MSQIWLPNKCEKKRSSLEPPSNFNGGLNKNVFWKTAINSLFQKEIKATGQDLSFDTRQYQPYISGVTQMRLAVLPSPSSQYKKKKLSVAEWVEQYAYMHI